MKAVKKDFWMEIRRSKARFLSIFFIVALGVAFFSGIQASSPDMRYSGDAYFDDAALMDIRVMGTLGLTDKDLEAVRKVEGVQSAEGAYSQDVMTADIGNKVLHIESLNDTVNHLKVKDGRLPEKKGEIFLDSLFAQGQGYKTGDTLEIIQEGDNQLLKTEKYTITGTGSCPMYISFQRGNTTLGSGEINGFAYVVPEEFDSEVYTQMYIHVKGARELISYTSEYDDLIERISDKIGEIEEDQCQIRYDDIIADAREELDKAQKELDDGRKEAEEKLADAEKELIDGEKELADGKKEYKDGKKELKKAKQELEDARQQIADAKREISDGKTQLADAKAQAADGQTQLQNAKATLSQGWAEVNANQKQLEAGEAQLAEGKKQFEDGKGQISAAKKELEQKQAEIEAAKTQIAAGKEQIAASRVQLAENQKQLEEGKAGLAEQEQTVAAGEAAVADARAQVQALQAQYEEAAAAQVMTEEELAAMAAQIAAMQVQVDEQAAAVEAARAQLEAARQEIEGGLAQVAAGLEELTKKEQELAATEAQLPEAQAQIEQGKKTIEEQESTIAASEKEIKEKESQLASARAQLEAAKNKLYAGQAEIDANESKLSSAWAEIAANEQKLADGEREIKENEQKLADGEKEIKENEEKLADAKKDLEDGEKELKEGREEYEEAKKDAEKEIADGEEKIRDAQEEIDKIEVPEWMITDRHNLPEYSDYGDNADRIRNIGEVFPVIFFLVAALVSLTTMTRMVEEQRTQIGTMKALGYGKLSIASKYLNYALLATVGGSILGILSGEKVLPYIIIKAYGIMYHNMASKLQIHYEFKYAMIASGAAVFCTLGATIFSCYKAMAETPASLMRPPAPKEGKRVLIERMTFLWKHLSFTWKSTLRNLFRYKKRLFMTIFGIAGSMALLLVGFGLRDSIMDIAGKQYSQLQHYDATIIGDEDASDKEKQELRDFLSEQEQIDHYTPVSLTNMTAPRERKSGISVYVYVPENTENFEKDITLQDRKTKEQYQLPQEGVVICEKTAALLGIGIGDKIILEKEHQEYNADVAVITENYMGHYVYMTSQTYEKVFGEKPESNSIVFSVNDLGNAQIEELGNEILNHPGALSISYIHSMEEQLDRMLSTLGLVIVVLIVSAGMLAFVVLYNLNNINITERQRELATLKVLGFYDKEVSAYVFRENILLSLLGILGGVVFGFFLHRYVITTVEVDAVMFGRDIKPISYVYSALFTIGFSLIVNFFMHRKLKKIDMVESLKSVE